MFDLHPPMVCLDGNAIKRLRESQQLTQLYVSKVVGVTTDTISRWENNRYPSIKRENALKLAEALEVELEAILRQPGETAPPPPQTSPRRRLILALVAGAGLLVVALVWGLFFHGGDLPLAPDLEVRRKLPAHAAPGAIIPVRITLNDAAATGGFILREAFPQGWKLVQAHPPVSSIDNEKGVARWIVKADESRAAIVYLVKVADPADGSTASFRGEVIVGRSGDESVVPVGGAMTVPIDPFHWADQDGDGVIDDAEMLQASHVVDEMKGVHIDWLYLERLWNAGNYRWDDERGDFVPVRAR